MLDCFCIGLNNYNKPLGAMNSLHHIIIGYIMYNGIQNLHFFLQHVSSKRFRRCAQTMPSCIRDAAYKQAKH